MSEEDVGVGAVQGAPLIDSQRDLGELELGTKIQRPSADLAEPLQIIRYVQRIRGSLREGAKVAVVGCGPEPVTVRALVQAGFAAVGVEPVPRLAESARAWLGDRAMVKAGSAEDLPFENESQDVVIMESVLEHAESVGAALSECFRVCAPRGVLYVLTTNRLAFRNDEFTLPFYQWLPPLVQESVVHAHLHRNPRLARFTTRPAVHWFTFGTLCGLGREAGFYRFYSKVDLVRRSDRAVANRPLRLAALNAVQRSWLLRSLALTQRAGGTCFMVRRGGPAEECE